jgi:hypothetical protein
LFKQLFLFCSLILFVTFSIVGSAASAGLTSDMSVLSLRGDTSNMTKDQVVELQRVGKWMDKDIIKQLKKVGFNAKTINSQKDFKGPGHLLIIEVVKFKPGNRAARAFVGFGAGGSSLDLQYKLLDSRGASLSTWEDGVGSSRGGTYCAQTLNRNVIKKLKAVMN